jgi:hypothetical protein
MSNPKEKEEMQFTLILWVLSRHIFNLFPELYLYIEAKIFYLPPSNPPL